jgi:hypothetical protein
MPPASWLDARSTDARKDLFRFPIETGGRLYRMMSQKEIRFVVDTRPAGGPIRAAMQWSHRITGQNFVPPLNRKTWVLSYAPLVIG